jgi:hypothetical protein
LALLLSWLTLRNGFIDKGARIAQVLVRFPPLILSCPVKVSDNGKRFLVNTFSRVKEIVSKVRNDAGFVVV